MTKSTVIVFILGFSLLFKLEKMVRIKTNCLPRVIRFEIVIPVPNALHCKALYCTLLIGAAINDLENSLLAKTSIT